MSNAIETQGTKLGIQSAIETTVSLTFDSSAGTITRAAGDWTTNVTIGMWVTTTDTDNPGPYYVSAVTTTVLTVTGDADGTAPVMTTDAVAADFNVTEYKSIGEVTDFDGPGGSAAVIDTSSLDSTRREKLMGLPDEGQITFSLNFVPGNAGQVAFRTARSTRAETNFLLVFADASTVAIPTYATFAGFALEFSVSGAVDDKVTANATIEITGEVSWSDD